MPYSTALISNYTCTTADSLYVGDYAYTPATTVHTNSTGWGYTDYLDTSGYIIGTQGTAMGYTTDLAGNDGTLNLPGYLSYTYEPWKLSEAQVTELRIYQKKSALRTRCAPILVKSRANPIPRNLIPSEQIAMETLREMISEDDFRKYIKHGFILVRGQSGKVYQIFRDRPHTVVWKNGDIVEEICIRIRGDIGAPCTDNVIAIKVMVETDEDALHEAANVYPFENGKRVSNAGSITLYDGNAACITINNGLLIQAAA